MHFLLENNIVSGVTWLLYVACTIKATSDEMKATSALLSFDNNAQVAFISSDVTFIAVSAGNIAQKC
jgi:hypothetical protein